MRVNLELPWVVVKVMVVTLSDDLKARYRQGRTVC